MIPRRVCGPIFQATATERRAQHGRSRLFTDAWAGRPRGKVAVGGWLSVAAAGRAGEDPSGTLGLGAVDGVARLFGPVQEEADHGRHRVRGGVALRRAVGLGPG